MLDEWRMEANEDEKCSFVGFIIANFPRYNTMLIFNNCQEALVASLILT